MPRVGFEPTTYRLRSGCSTAELPGQRPAGDRGAYRDELLASNPAQAKPFRDINPWSTSWSQFPGGLAIRCRGSGGIGRDQVSEVRTDSPQNTTEIEILEAKERWSEYRLADGTTLRLRPVMIAVFRADGQYTADGDPVYDMKSTLITDVRGPGSAAKPDQANEIR